MYNFKEICSQLETLAKVNYNGYILKDWLEYLVLILNTEEQKIKELRSNPEDFKQFLRFLLDQKFWTFYDPQVSNELSYKISYFINENVDFLLNKDDHFDNIQDLYVKVQKYMNDGENNDKSINWQVYIKGQKIM